VNSVLIAWYKKYFKNPFFFLKKKWSILTRHEIALNFGAWKLGQSTVQQTCVRRQALQNPFLIPIQGLCLFTAHRYSKKALVLFGPKNTAYCAAIVKKNLVPHTYWPHNSCIDTQSYPFRNQSTPRLTKCILSAKYLTDYLPSSSWIWTF